ncbi:GntR family transcriptional regulator [Paenibacillus thiaminolyticus]|uniref:GntR family transcriptional regulator n=1 Tax=Paenibacillus thiaminolyticus TaxID=49283 RepID=UPI00217583E5|nr:GntR family transcriptional regulator [Paenibacillus thiaminolyticus]
MQFHIPYHISTQKYPSKRLALYYAIRDCTASGVLVIDMRLPSSREMAALYSLSRGTVNEVYDRLRLATDQKHAIAGMFRSLWK